MRGGRERAGSVVPAAPALRRFHPSEQARRGPRPSAKRKRLRRGCFFCIHSTSLRTGSEDVPYQTRCLAGIGAALPHLKSEMWGTRPSALGRWDQILSRIIDGNLRSEDKYGAMTMALAQAR